MLDRRRTAFHEAGHAVVGHHVGRPASKIVIAETYESSGKTTYYPSSTGWWREIKTDSPSPEAVAEAERMTVCYWAGPIAADMATGVPWTTGAGLALDEATGEVLNLTFPPADSHHIFEIATDLCRGDQKRREVFIYETFARANELLRDDRVWHGVEAVAAVLLQQDEMSGDEIKRVLDALPAQPSHLA